MTYKEQNKFLSVVLNNSKLTIKNDLHENNVYYRPLPSVSVGIKQTDKGRNYMFIKYIGAENEVVQYFYGTVESICKDFASVALNIEKNKLDSLEKFYEFGIYPNKQSSSYVREMNHFIIAITNRQPFQRISINFYEKDKITTEEDSFPSKSLAIYKKMEDKDFILTSSKITENTRKLEEIAKQFLIDGDEYGSEYVSDIDIISSQLIVAAKYCEDAAEMTKLEDALVEAVRVAEKDTLTDCAPLMEIYSQAKDSFDVKHSDDVNENGFSYEFLCKILLEIMFVLCDKDKPTMINALKDICLNPETEVELEKTFRVAIAIDALESIIVQKRKLGYSTYNPDDGEEFTNEELMKIFDSLKEYKDDGYKKIDNIKKYDKIVKDILKYKY